MSTYQSCAQPSEREIAPRDIESLLVADTVDVYVEIVRVFIVYRKDIEFLISRDVLILRDIKICVD
jgi:hypothetical protein